ncbi:MAG: response regulator [Actinobacteria bacterium]|nr:response regulator [Actinomycetota bacterium]
MGDTGPIRVLVCDDSPTFAAGLRRLLEHEPEIEVVGVRGSAEEAIAAVPELAPDLVTMDVELPGMNGLDAVERIMREHPVPILVLSSRTTVAEAALAAGAVAALAKDEVALREPDGDAATALRRRLRTLAGRA